MKSYDEAGDLLAVNELTTVVRGAGGWGGDRGPTGESNAAPDRPADAVIEEKISDNQALLYRLSGDWNPLHADPAFASAFGFPRPILHGLCTFGYAARHVIKSFAKNKDARYFKSIKARFADSVFPGETLITEMWREGDGRVLVRCKVKERDKVVISNAAVEFYDVIPEKKTPTKAETPVAKAAQSGPPASAEPNSADIFAGIGKYLEKNPDLAGKIATVYQFKLTSPDSAWTVDVKNGGGKVASGAPEKADCTLELSDADFMAMCTGKADPQKLYFGGKLKISGNVMASQKLEFLKKIDPQMVIDAMKARVGSGAAAPAAAPAPAPAAPSGDTSADVFVAIGDHIEKHPELVAKTSTVFQFKLTSPDSAYVLDLKNGKGSVTAGAAEKADCTLELSDADFIAMATGKADPQKLYFGGKLKISGNVMASQKLMFLKEIDPEAAKKAVKAKRAQGAAAPAAAAPAAASKGAQAAEIIEKLKARLAETPDLAKETAAVVQLRIKSPDADWTIDLKSGGGVKIGVDKGADVTLTLSDDDFAAMVRGSESAQHLFQNGKMRVDGDIRIAAHRLGFLKGLA